MTPLIWILWFTCFFGYVIEPHYVGLILGALIGATLVLAATIGGNWEQSRPYAPKRRLW